jgi:hypothetical protein
VDGHTTDRDEVLLRALRDGDEQLALVCPLPEVKDALDAGVAGVHRVVALLQHAAPHLTHEDVRWRLYFTLTLSRQTEWDRE